MSKRYDLNQLIIDVSGVTNVYFQPTVNIKMKYPCVVYHLGGASNKFANNSIYNKKKLYKLTIIDKDPDSEIPDAISLLPYCSPGTPYITDGLNHFVYDLYY